MKYKLSLGSCLMVWLDKFGYIDIQKAIGEGGAKYEAQLKDLFELLYNTQENFWLEETGRKNV